MYYYDIETKRIKTSTHGIFDEANITVPLTEWSTASQALIDLGYRQDDERATRQESQAPPVARIHLRSPTAKTPTQGSVLATGYDVYSTVNCVLQPQMVAKIPLGLTIAPPQGTYAQLHSRSGLASKGIMVYAGVIDPDYRGDITVLLYNNGSTAYTVNVGDHIAQLIFHNISSPVLLQQAQLDDTERADQGFGSTGINSATEVPQVSQVAAPLPYLNPVDVPYNIFLSQDPFDDVITLTVKDFGTHDTMGMILQPCSQRNKPKLVDIQPSQRCSRIKKWRSTIKNGYITQIEEYTISSIEDVKTAIRASRTKHLEHIHIEVALDIKPTGIHPVEGIPQLFSDQLYVIQQHLQSIRDSTYHAESLEVQQPQVHTVTTSTDIHNTIFQQFIDTQHPVLRTLLDANYNMDVDISPAASPGLLGDLPQHPTTNPVLHPQDHPSQHPVEPLPPPPPEAVRYTWKQIKDDPEWIHACFQQLDQYEDQDMFDKPRPKPAYANA